MQCSVQGLGGEARELMHHRYRNRWEKQKEAAAANQSSKEVAASRRLHRTREEGGLGSNDEIPAMYQIPRPAGLSGSAPLSDFLCSSCIYFHQRPGFVLCYCVADASDSSSLPPFLPPNSLRLSVRITRLSRRYEPSVKSGRVTCNSLALALVGRLTAQYEMKL